jgi:DNA-binding NarL/FixJ family response regulator
MSDPNSPAEAQPLHAVAADEHGIRVVVADDQSTVRDGLIWLLQSLPGIDVVGQAADGLEALDVVRETSPDVLLLDLRMPRLDGVETARRLKADAPGTRILVLTTYADDDSILQAVDAGACGYLTKDADRADIERAIRTAAAGQAVLDAAVYARLVGAALRAPARQDSPSDLSPREMDVLRLVARGHSNRMIASALFISEATVKSHINHIFTKISVTDRAAAVAYAFTTGIADPSA